MFYKSIQEPHYTLLYKPVIYFELSIYVDQ